MPDCPLGICQQTRPFPEPRAGGGGPGAADMCPVLGRSPPLPDPSSQFSGGFRLLGEQDLDRVLSPNASALCAAAQTGGGGSWGGGLGKPRAISGASSI